MSTDAVTRIRADVFAYLGITDDVFLPEGHKIKRVQEDRRRDLGAMVTTSMVTVADLRAAFAAATGAELTASPETVHAVPDPGTEVTTVYADLQKRLIHGLHPTETVERHVQGVLADLLTHLDRQARMENP